MLNRRELIGGAVGMTAAVSLPLAADEAPGVEPGAYGRAFGALDAFIAQYLEDIGAPGLTLALADSGGVRRVAAFGFDDLARTRPLRTDQLFEIGSISKSFVALCLLQLREEGKLDFNRPIAEYLPWLRIESSLGPIKVHDLMTHGAGLPDGPLFPADPTFVHRPANPPGSDFHYCNMGWQALGHLIEALDNRRLGDSLRARLFAPLGMSASEPATTFECCTRMATSHMPLWADRPYPRRGPLVPAPPIVSTDGAGCIAAVPADMGRYLAMLARRGALAHGRVVSEESFRRFSTPYLAAEEFGNDASYGYGIAVDRLDGHTRLRHTGGMVSFASALEVDLDEGVGAFASVNAMQGLRPRPVAEYALRLMRACRSGAPLPEPPPRDDPRRVARAADYAGRYTNPDGHSIEIKAEDGRLLLMRGRERLTLESSTEPEAFHVDHPDYTRYLLSFTRANPKDPTSPVTELGHGEFWFTRPPYAGPQEFTVPAEWPGYCGHYRSEDPWLGSHRVVARRGRLWLDGIVPLEAAPDGRFWLRDDARSPEWAKFADSAGGRSMRLVLSGADFARVMTA